MAGLLLSPQQLPRQAALAGPRGEMHLPARILTEVGGKSSQVEICGVAD